MSVEPAFPVEQTTDSILDQSGIHEKKEFGKRFEEASHLSMSVSTYLTNPSFWILSAI